MDFKVVDKKLSQALLGLVGLLGLKDESSSEQYKGIMDVYVRFYISQVP